MQPPGKNQRAGRPLLENAAGRQNRPRGSQGGGRGRSATRPLTVFSRGTRFCGGPECRWCSCHQRGGDHDMLKKVLFSVAMVVSICLAQTSFSADSAKDECKADKDCKDGKVCILVVTPHVCKAPQ